VQRVSNIAGDVPKQM